MYAKPLNRETFLSDIAGRNALVTCMEIDTACELMKAAFSDPSGVNVTFTTDQEEALDTASYKQSKSLVFTLGSEDTVTTF